MTRRPLFRSGSEPVGWLAAFLLILVLGARPAAAAELFTEGVQYAKLAVPVETLDPSRIEVLEVFSYACIHCKTFDPTLDVWAQTVPDDVLFRRMPAIFNQTWALFAAAFYTAEVLEVTDKVHTPMFLAIHEEGVDLRDPTLMAALFEQAAGIPPEEYTQISNSFAVRSRVQQAEAHGRAYGLTGVPTLIVDGRYRVDGRMAGNNTKMLQVVEFLIAQARAEKGLSAPSADSTD